MEDIMRKITDIYPEWGFRITNIYPSSGGLMRYVLFSITSDWKDSWMFPIKVVSSQNEETINFPLKTAMIKFLEAKTGEGA